MARSNRLPHPAFVLALLVMSAGGAALRYYRVAFGSESFYWDIVNIWHPIAERVLNGHALYAAAWDNKPPLWEFLNLATAATGQHHMAFFVALTAANAAAALLLARLCAQHGWPHIGQLAAVLFLAVLPMTHGFVINPRQFAAVGLLVALLTTRPAVSGLAIAAAGLLTQYSVLAIPVVVWRRWRRNGSLRGDWRWYVTFAAAGLATAAVAYLAVAAIWGVDAMAVGIRYSMLSLSDYASQKADESLWTRPVWRIKEIGKDLRAISVIAVLAGIGAVRSVIPTVRDTLRSHTPAKTDGGRTYALARHALALTALLSIQTMIRPGGGIYHMAYLPFVAILAAFGAYAVLRSPRRDRQAEGDDQLIGPE